MNRNYVAFKEEQRFTQIWLWLLLLGLAGFSIYGTISQVVFGHTFGSKPMSDTQLIIFTCFMITFVFLFLNVKLHTKMNEEGIYVRLFPFHLKDKFFPWDKISKAYVRKYSPIIEYGGWGIRIGLMGRGKAYNTSGNKGIQLVLSDGSKLLIGTHKPELAAEALREAGFGEE